MANIRELINKEFDKNELYETLSDITGCNNEEDSDFILDFINKFEETIIENEDNKFDEFKFKKLIVTGDGVYYE